MPKLNDTGSVLAGIAGVPSSIDGVTIPVPTVLGDGSWLTPTLVAVQAGTDADGYRLVSSDGVVLENQGTFFLAASGTGAYRTERSGDGKGRPIAGAEGLIAVIDDYSAGIGLSLYRDDGSIAYTDLGIVVGPPARNCAIRNGLLTFWTNRWELINISAGQSVPFLRRTDDVNWLVPVADQTGHIWLLERTDAVGITLRRADSWIAAVLVPGPSHNLFNPDVVWLTSGPRIAYSVSIGEEIPNVRVVNPDLASLPTINTNPSGGPVDPPVPPVTPPPSGSQTFTFSVPALKSGDRIVITVT